MKFDTGFDQSTFMAKIKKLYNDKMDSISFIVIFLFNFRNYLFYFIKT